MNLKTRILIFFAVLAIFLVIVLYVLEFQWFQNSFGARELVMGSLMAGGIISLFLGFFLAKRGQDWVDKAQIWTACLVGPMLVMPLIASLANRLFADKVENKQMVFWEEKAYITSRYGKLQAMQRDTTGFFVFVVREEGEIQRLSWPSSKFSTAKQGDTILVPVRRGLFGIEFVDFME